MSKRISLKTIGKINTPHKTIENMPIQPSGAFGIEGVVEIEPEFEEGLKDLEGFSDIILIYHLHKVNGYKLLVKPFMDNKEHGIFATRSPKRPSPIGLSTVKLTKIQGCNIYFEGADMLDGTPLIDVKPFFRQTDNRLDAVCGWLDEKSDNLAKHTRSDERFK